MYELSDIVITDIIITEIIITDIYSCTLEAFRVIDFVCEYSCREKILVKFIFNTSSCWHNDNAFLISANLPDFIDVSDVLCLKEPNVNLVRNFFHTRFYVFQVVRDLIELL